MLLKRYKMEDRKIDIKFKYDGYRVLGADQGLYNMGAVRSIISPGNNVWAPMAKWLSVLSPCFADKDFGAIMLSSLKQVTILYDETNDTYRLLYNILNKIRSLRSKYDLNLNEFEKDCILQYFFQSGYYSLTEDSPYPEKGCTKIIIKPTNEETRRTLRKEIVIGGFVYHRYNLTEDEIQRFCTAISNIKSDKKAEYLELLKSVHSLVEHAKIGGEIEFQPIIYYAIEAMAYHDKLQAYDYEDAISNGKVLDFALLGKNSKVAMLLELECTETATVGLKQIFSQNSTLLFGERSLVGKDFTHMALISMICITANVSEDLFVNNCSLCYLFRPYITDWTKVNLNDATCLKYP